MNEGKVQPRFQTVYLKHCVLADPWIGELKQWCEKFSALGLAPTYGSGSYGNLSFRSASEPDSFIITASGSDLGHLAPADFVEVAAIDPDQMTISVNGMKPPSSEALLHAAIYFARPEINAIFHGHSQAVMAKAMAQGMPVTEKEAPYGSLELIEEVKPLVMGNDFMVMKEHGFLSLGRSMEEAGERLVHYG